MRQQIAAIYYCQRCDTKEAYIKWSDNIPLLSDGYCHCCHRITSHARQPLFDEINAFKQGAS